MRYISSPFATSGDREEIPMASQPSGQVSYTQGYGPDYSADPEADPDAKLIERTRFNAVLFDVTTALKLWQDQAFPDYVAVADKPGGYALGAVVRVGDVLYRSTVAGNLNAPPHASWTVINLGPATQAVAGSARFATSGEVVTGTATDLMVSPATLAAYFGVGGPVPSTRAITAGDGLTGGGSLAADRAIALGTPSTLTGATTNALTPTSHTHALSLAVADVAGAAPLSSPAFTNTPTAPTPPEGNTSTRLATTAFVAAAVSAGLSGLGSLATLNSVNNANWSGTPLAITNGGTGATGPTSALAALGGVSTALTITAGNGLTGGGTLAGNRTLALGTPTSITAASTNTSSGTTHSHALTMSTAAQYRANSSGNPIGPDEIWAAAAPVALAQAATLVVNFNQGINFSTTMTGNRILGNPSSAATLKQGQSGVIEILQDATGGRTLTYGSNWLFPGGVVPTLSTAPNARDVLAYTVLGPTAIVANLLKGVA